MTFNGLKVKLSKAAAVVMIAMALFTTEATLVPTAAMAATSGSNCLTGLCCAADAW